MIPVRVGNSILDHDHTELSHLLDDLHALWINRCSGSILLAGLIRFENALCAHFAVEEAILGGCAYADLSRHQGQHRAVLAEVASFRHRLAGQTPNDDERPLHAFDVASRLSDLLYAHELVEDSAYIPALTAPPILAEDQIQQHLSPLVEQAAALKEGTHPAVPNHGATEPALTPQATHALARLVQGLADGRLQVEQIAADFLPYWRESPDPPT